MTDTVVDRFPSKHIPPVTKRDLPPPPKSTWRVIGPGVIAAGVGLASGEFILLPYIASQVGLVFLWAAAVGIVTQWFLNMEIERYTLATGETALTGFSRFWRHWGLVFAVLVYFANLWPGWASSSATMVTYLFGGDAAWIAVGMLLVIGVDADPRAGHLQRRWSASSSSRSAWWCCFSSWPLLFAISADAWQELPRAVTAPEFPTELGFALMLSALVFAGAGGGQNLVPEQLDPGQGLRHGRVRPAAGQPGHRQAGGRAGDRLRVRAHRGEHGALAALVAAGQHGAGSSRSC